MASCKDCIHYSVCGYVEFQDLECKQFKPNADVVEVIRCKDCKHFVSEICRHDFAMNLSRADDFCSYGERRDT
jgi:hypothetical protein